MKTFKTIAVLAFFVIGSVSFAQGPRQGGSGGGRQMRSATERAKSETQRLVKDLSLDEAQTAKILEINLKYAAKDSVRMAEMRNSGGQIDREKMIKEMQAQQEVKSAEVQAILKGDQVAKYKEYLIERQQRRQGGQNGQGRTGGEPRN